MCGSTRKKRGLFPFRLRHVSSIVGGLLRVIYDAEMQALVDPDKQKWKDEFLAKLRLTLDAKRANSRLMAEDQYDELRSALKKDAEGTLTAKEQKRLDKTLIGGFYEKRKKYEYQATAGELMPLNL